MHYESYTLIPSKVMYSILQWVQFFFFLFQRKFKDTSLVGMKFISKKIQGYLIEWATHGVSHIPLIGSMLNMPVW